MIKHFRWVIMLTPQYQILLYQLKKTVKSLKKKLKKKNSEHFVNKLEQLNFVSSIGLNISKINQENDEDNIEDRNDDTENSKSETASNVSRKSQNPFCRSLSYARDIPFRNWNIKFSGKAGSFVMNSKL